MTPAERDAAARIGAAVEAEIAVLTSESDVMQLPTLDMWVVLCHWVDAGVDQLDSGGMWATRLKKPGTSDLMMKGMLHEALFGVWDTDD